MNLIRLSTVALIFAILCVCIRDTLCSDYYATLEVSRSASDTEIRSAYKRLSRKYHPDKNRGNAEAEAMYLKINEAFDVLGDEEKKHIYDTYGEEGLKQSEQQGGGGPGGFGFGGGPQFFRTANGGFSFSFDPFGQQRGPRRGPDLNIEFYVTLEELYNGAEYEIEQHKPGGDGDLDADTHVLVLERGMSDSDTISFEGAADRQKGVLPGSVTYYVRQLPHRMFERRDNDLYMRIELPLLQAMVGFTTTVKHLDGHEVVIERSTVTKHDEMLTIRGEGMPIRGYPSERGDLYVHVTVKFPGSVNDRQKTLLREAFA